MQKEFNDLYFVTGGGTGGHIYPAIAIANKLKEDAEVFYVGNKRNMEFSLSKQLGYKFLHVNISGMPRKLNIKLLLWLKKLWKSIFYAVAYIKKYKPKAVFATGGYVSAPMIFACVITKTPYMMHDCDAMPGLVTRLLSVKADYVSLAFNNAKKYIHNKNIIVTGNPIRSDFFNMDKKEAFTNIQMPEKMTLCVTGGSQGANSINNTVIELLEYFSKELNLQIIFQTGNKNYETVVSKLQNIYPEWEQDSNLLIKPYYQDMVSVLKASDVVISRSGSLSLSEICASECAPILIPYPYAAADHQRINAKSLLAEDACIYIDDNQLNCDILKNTVTKLVKNPEIIENLKNNSSKLVKKNATQTITEHIKSLTKRA